MTTKHTPGPWTIEPATGTLCAWLVTGPHHSLPDTRQTLAFIAQTIGDNSVENANARLIAAAPELLEALIQTCDLLDMAQSCVDNKRDSDRIYAGCVAGRAAITKATTL